MDYLLSLIGYLVSVPFSYLSFLVSPVSFDINSITDILLCFYIVGGICAVSFIKHKNFITDLDFLYETKKNFYYFTKAGLMIVLLHFVLSLFALGFTFFDPINSTSTLLNIYETYTFATLKNLDVYNQLFNNQLGVLFFRHSLLTQAFILILNICVITYLLLLLNYLNLTKENFKYLAEIPILVVTVFLALKYFIISYDSIVLIISLELASLCSVILLSLQVTTTKNIYPFEAAIKYFLFNAIATAFLLVSFTGYFFMVENFNLLDLSTQSILNPYFQLLNFESLVFLHFLFFIGYLMKLGCAPFHFWVPDVYEGAEFIFTAFLILVVSPVLNFKLFVFIKLLIPTLDIYHIIFSFFLCCGVLSIVIGVFNAMTQFKLKRFLAYASINHFGFILVSLANPTFIGFFSSLFYLVTYILTNIIFFSVILLIQQFNLVTFIYLNQLKSLVRYSYLIFGLFLIPLFSFAGFPPFAGFFGKFFVFVSLLDFKKVWVALFILIYVVLNAYLYLRFIKIALFEPNKISFYVPVNFTYKKITTKYHLNKSMYLPNTLRYKMNFFIIFIINILLLAFVLFLPTIGLFCSHIILNLFIFG